MAKQKDMVLLDPGRAGKARAPFMQCGKPKAHACEVVSLEWCHYIPREGDGGHC